MFSPKVWWWHDRGRHDQGDTMGQVLHGSATTTDALRAAMQRLKSLAGLTPFERICQLWTEQPERFRLNPLQHMAGRNILVDRRQQDEEARATYCFLSEGLASCR